MDTLGLLGASGSGKSMTLRCIAGIDKPDCGRMVLNGRTLFDSNKGINLPCRKRKLGYLFQNYALFPNMTVEENIGFGIGDKKREDRIAIIKEKVKKSPVWRAMKLKGKHLLDIESVIGVKKYYFY